MSFQRTGLSAKRPVMGKTRHKEINEKENRFRSVTFRSDVLNWVGLQLHSEKSRSGEM